jgi:lactoylglutathione lyase
MNFAYTILYVEQVEETLNFYEKAFGFRQKFITPEKDYGELLSGETTLAFASIALGESNFKQGFQPIPKAGKPMGAELVFTTNEIDTDFQKALDAGATLYEPITQKPWGQQVGYVRDNNGFLIEICTPIAAEE